MPLYPASRLSNGPVQVQIDRIVNDPILRIDFKRKLDVPGEKGRNWLNYIVEHTEDNLKPALEEMTDYLRQSWFHGQPEAGVVGRRHYWKPPSGESRKNLPPSVEALIRESLKKAINLIDEEPGGESRDQSRRFNSYWMCIGNEEGTENPDDATIEVFLMWNEVSVTQIILTPKVNRALADPPREENFRNEENIYIIKGYKGEGEEESGQLVDRVDQDGQEWMIVRPRKWTGREM